jgi:hypothetical protein
MTTTQTAEALTADYIEARIRSRSTTDIRTRHDAQRTASRIARKAESLGIRLDEIELDEQARRMVIARKAR